MRKCPACGSVYQDHPAISRRDNHTEICPQCGLREALEDFGMPDEKANEILQKIMKSYLKGDRYIK